MMSLWDALRMNMMISYQELVRTFLNVAFAAWHIFHHNVYSYSLSKNRRRLVCNILKKMIPAKHLSQVIKNLIRLKNRRV